MSGKIRIPAHTPGPWQARDNPVRRNRVVTVSAGALATVHSDADSAFADPVGLANALLISAAPEMYVALRRIISELPARRDWLDPTVEAVARAALAKVEGTE